MGAWQGWTGTEPGQDTQPSASSPWTSTKQGTDPVDKEGGNVQELSPRAGTQKEARSAGRKARATAVEDQASMPATRDDPTPTRTCSTVGFYINLIWHNRLMAGMASQWHIRNAVATDPIKTVCLSWLATALERFVSNFGS